MTACLKIEAWRHVKTGLTGDGDGDGVGGGTLHALSDVVDQVASTPSKE